MMEKSRKESYESLPPATKLPRCFSLPIALIKSSKKNSFNKPGRNLYKSAGLRTILKKKKPLIMSSYSKIAHTDSYKSNSPSYSEYTPKIINRELNEINFTEKFHHFPSVTSNRKNFPSLCTVSISEILQKKKQKSNAIFTLNSPHFSKNPSLKEIEFSPKRLHSIFERNSKKNIKSPAIVEVNTKICQETKSIFEKTLSEHFLFKNFTENYKEILFNSMRCFHVSSDSVILKEESFAELIYFLEFGLIGAYKQDNLVRHLKAGSVIGEQQILSVSPLTCSYIALEKSILWGVNSEVIAKIMLEMNEKKYKENREFLTPIPYFKSLDDSQIDEICYNMTSVRFSKGTVVIKEGESYINFYIIKEGVALANANNKFSHYLQKGEFFGQALFRKKGEPYSIFVDTEYLDCLCMNYETFKKILGGNYEKIVSYNLVETALNLSETFSKISLKESEQIIEARNLLYYEKDQEIPLGKALYVVIDGKLSSKAKGRNLLCGEIIGEENLIAGKEFKDKVLTLDECFLAMIEKKKIEEIIGLEVKDLFLKEKESQKKDLFKENLEKIGDHKIVIDFTKTKILKILGEGLSGLVLLVEYEGAQYALKIISKGWIIENKFEAYTRNEKIIQDKIDFSFITKIRTTSKDDLSVYFFMEYVKGVDLFEILLENQELDESSTKFYIGSLLLALEYLHRKGILHRDLKPENILIDDHGYIKLCDLGFAKLLLKKTQRTYTNVGTPHYMAPEMITGKGYSFPIDHYAIGVIAYVLFFGEFPYGEGLEDTFQIYNAVVNQKLKFPKKKSINEDLKFMLKKLLKKNPEARLGKNCESCRYQKWFENYPWDKLLEKKVEPPFIPQLQDKGEEIKNMNLHDLIQQNDINLLKEMTNELTSSFANWDDVF